MVRILNYYGYLMALVAWVGLQLVPAAMGLDLDSPWNNNAGGGIGTAPWNTGMSSSILTVERYCHLNQRGGSLDSPWNMNLDASLNMKSNIDAPWNIKNHQHLDAPWNMENHLDAPWTSSSRSSSPNQDTSIVGHATSSFYDALDSFFA